MSFYNFTIKHANNLKKTKWKRKRSTELIPREKKALNVIEHVKYMQDGLQKLENDLWWMLVHNYSSTINNQINKWINK